MTSKEILHVGPPASPRRGHRPGFLLVLIVALAACLTGAGINASRQQSRAFDQSETVAAFESLHLDSAQLTKLDELDVTGSPVQTSPAECAPLINLRAAEAVDGWDWSEYDDEHVYSELSLIRFDNRMTATRTVAAWRSGLSHCTESPVKINGETERTDFLVTELEPRLGDRLTTIVGWRISQGDLSVNVMARSDKNTLLMPVETDRARPEGQLSCATV